jgi:serine/threonine protein phosphatase PrpC
MDVSKHCRFGKWLKVSLATSKGNVRPLMEDMVDVADFKIGTKHFYAFLVYDGHGASKRDAQTATVGIIASNFIKYLKARLQEYNGTNIRRCIEDVFLLLQHDVKNKVTGTTVSMLLIVTEQNANACEFWVSNIGDSSIFGFRKNKIQKLSRDHKTSLPSELARIKTQSGYQGVDDGYIISKSGAQLSMTRALGDSDFSDIISNKPTTNKLKTDWDVFTVASDGIYDVMSGSELWPHIQKHSKHWKTCAENVLKFRNTNFEQHDNCALLIIFVDVAKMKEQEKK